MDLAEGSNSVEYIDCATWVDNLRSFNLSCIDLVRCKGCTTKRDEQTQLDRAHVRINRVRVRAP